MLNPLIIEDIFPKKNVSIKNSLCFSTTAKIQNGKERKTFKISKVKRLNGELFKLTL